MRGGGARWPAMSRSSPGGFGFKAEKLGQNAVELVGNLCFAFFVVVVIAFTVIAATYQPDDPLLHPPTSSRLSSIFSSTLNATFRSDRDSVARTGEDFLSPNFTSVLDEAPITTQSVGVDESDGAAVESCPGPVDCADTVVFQAMMRAAIERFPDIHYYRFGKAVAVAGSATGEFALCDMAWRFRPKDAKRASFYKDYRRFAVSRSLNCTISVVTIGEYHSGVNARKRKQKQRDQDDQGFGKLVADESPAEPTTAVVPLVGEAVNDTLPVVESEASFVRGRYLVYSGGGDRCKSMNHYLWSFLCSLGEAQYLNRTLVMDLGICLSSMYSKSGMDEEGKDFRFYFDFGHLRDSASVLDQSQFWTDWNRWEKKDGLRLHLVEDPLVPPMKLAEVKDALIMRKFGDTEPDNYWYRVCEGETESVIQRPWELIWKSRRLMDIVSGIASKMGWDFDAVHVVRGEKVANAELWPNLAWDTSPGPMMSKLREKGVIDGRRLFVATDEADRSFFDPLRERYSLYFLEDFKEMWGEGSEWHSETAKLNNGVAVEFDGYMRGQVDNEVFLRGKKQFETFNDLTGDCKDGVNTCVLPAGSSSS